MGADGKFEQGKTRRYAVQYCTTVGHSTPVAKERRFDFRTDAETFYTWVRNRKGQSAREPVEADLALF